MMIEEGGVADGEPFSYERSGGEPLCGFFPRMGSSVTQRPGRKYFVSFATFSFLSCSIIGRYIYPSGKRTCGGRLWHVIGRSIGEPSRRRFYI